MVDVLTSFSIASIWRTTSHLVVVKMWRLGLQSLPAIAQWILQCGMGFESWSSTTSTRCLFGIYLRWANPGLFFVYFWSFQTNNTIFTSNQYKKCPSSIQNWDYKPRPLEHESSPITTRPGLPPTVAIVNICIFNHGFYHDSKHSRYMSVIYNSIDLFEILSIWYF